MTSDTLNLSRTERNLWNAIVSEAMAYLKYNAYAHKALEEGHPEVAQVFQEVAGAETIHGINHLRVAGAIGSTLDNLREVNSGETREFSIMYPRMIRDAQTEGRQDAADSFGVAMERETHHQRMFAAALEQLQEKLSRQEQEKQNQAATAPEPTVTTQPSLADLSLQGDNVPPMSLETYVAASAEVDRERWRVASFGRLREVVFGAQDGILSTVALVTSVAVAVEDRSTVLVAGLAAAFAGMISMATGAFLGSRAEQDVQRAEIQREIRELEEDPAEEYAELVVLYQREGKTYAEARLLADEISQDKDLWLRTMVEKELGLSMEETTNPIKDALAMGTSFILAALLPIIPYLFLEGNPAIGISVSIALIGLFGLGIGKGRLVQRSPILQGLEILGIGLVSATLGFVLGDVVPRLVT